jgi:fatty acid desaturase
MRLNLAGGRLLSIFFGTPFQILRQTHLSHHKFNRAPFEKGTEIYRPEKTSWFEASVGYYFYIVCGLYLLEVVSAAIFFLPRRFFDAIGQRLSRTGTIQEKWLAAKFADDKRRREIRMDGLAIVAVFGLSATAYGEHWRVFLCMLLMRAFLVSLMDNVYHYRTPLNVTASGHNLSAPGFLAFGLLNFNLHRVHHTNPSVPWAMLPIFFERNSDKYDRSLFLAVFEQFLGPVPEGQLDIRRSKLSAH